MPVAQERFVALATLTDEHSLCRPMASPETVVTRAVDPEVAEIAAAMARASLVLLAAGNLHPNLEPSHLLKIVTREKL